MSTGIGITTIAAELVVSIMAHLDGASLLALMGTCSTIHDVFEANKTEVLAKILNRIIDVECGATIDAEACMVAHRTAFYMKDDGHTMIDPALRIQCDHKLVDFLNKYRIRRAQRLASDQQFQDPDRTVFSKCWDTFPDRVSEETKSLESKVVEKRTPKPWPEHHWKHLTKLHKRHTLIQWCADQFCRQALALQPNEDSSTLQLELRQKPLSLTERKRLYRALYRFALWHDIFHGKTTLVPMRYNVVWFSSFPPHECEEIATVYQWLDDAWRKKLQNVVDLKYSSYAQRAAYVDEGLEGFFKMQQTDDVSTLHRLAERCQEKDENYLMLYGKCSVEMTELRTFDIQGIRDGYPEAGTKLSFENDHPDCPNYGWLWTYKFKMANYVHEFPHVDLRRIGHVMWDRDRLESWNAYDGTPPMLNRYGWQMELPHHHGLDPQGHDSSNDWIEL